MKNVHITIFLLLLLIMFSGCTNITSKLLIMEGNFRLSRGMHDEAIASYMKAIEHEEAVPYAEYGLGLVYLDMGENKAALERFSKAEQALEVLPPPASRELHYRIHYNTGIALFSGQDFAGATDSFQNALRVDSRKVEAKRNLELSILSLEREQTRDNKNEGSQNGTESESMAILLEFVRQKEMNQFRNQEWGEEANREHPDY